MSAESPVFTGRKQPEDGRGLNDVLLFFDQHELALAAFKHNPGLDSLEIKTHPVHTQTVFQFPDSPDAIAALTSGLKRTYTDTDLTNRWGANLTALHPPARSVYFLKRQYDETLASLTLVRQAVAKVTNSMGGLARKFYFYYDSAVDKVTDRILNQILRERVRRVVKIIGRIAPLGVVVPACAVPFRPPDILRQ